MHLKSIEQRYRNRAKFIFLYTAEPHPGSQAFLQHVPPEKRHALFGKPILPGEIRERARLFRRAYELPFSVCVNIETGSGQGADLVFPTGVIAVSSDGVIRVAEGVDTSASPMDLNIDRLDARLEAFFRDYASTVGECR